MAGAYKDLKKQVRTGVIGPTEYQDRREKLSIERQLAGKGVVNKVENLIGGKKRQTKLKQALKKNIENSLYY